MTILVFEQECLHKDDDSTAVLDEEYVRNYVVDEDYSITVEFESDTLLVMMAIDNVEGESYKFISDKNVIV